MPLSASSSSSSLWTALTSIAVTLVNHLSTATAFVHVAKKNKRTNSKMCFQLKHNGTESFNASPSVLLQPQLPYVAGHPRILVCFVDDGQSFHILEAAWVLALADY